MIGIKFPTWSHLVLALVCLLFNQQVRAGGNEEARYKPLPRASPPRMSPDAAAKLLAHLKGRDTCSTIFTSKSLGYEVLEYKVRTADNYELTLHRIVHPSDQMSGGPPKPGKKKPYLVLHGLIGSSASFVRFVDPNYRAPTRVFDTSDAINEILSHRREDYATSYQSTADHFNAAFEGDTTRLLAGASHKEMLAQKLVGKSSKRIEPFASAQEIDMDGDQLNFGKEFKQAHRKFELPASSRGHVTNSLALTMSNFGYDVWLLNLRGNQYSRAYNGPSDANRAEYWDFDIKKLIGEDLLASINFVRRQTESDRFGPMGLVAYSYSSIHVLGLLTQYPEYQKHLQPVVMMAPTLFTSTGNKRRVFMKLGSKFLVSHNGPFPDLARRGDKIVKLACNLPVASKLCRLFETILYGQAKSVKTLIFDDKKQQLVRKDVDCGQTSTAVLHQIIDNLSQSNIMPDYQPFVQARNRVMRGERFRRSVMLVHSDTDDIASLQEVTKIKDTALKQMTLVDYVIHEPNFGHTDFLFSKRNQYLVNAEIVRMATLFDFLLYRPASNRPIERTRGY